MQVLLGFAKDFSLSQAFPFKRAPQLGWREEIVGRKTDVKILVGKQLQLSRQEFRVAVTEIIMWTRREVR